MIIQAVSIADNGGSLNCHLSDGHITRFHSIWLRDNSNDDATKSSGNGQRLITIQDIPETVMICSARLADNRIISRFSDRDLDVAYDSAWLMLHCYDKDRSKRSCWFADWVETWDGCLAASLPLAEFDMVNADSRSLYGWLFNLRKYGFAKLENGPVKSGSLMDVASLFGFVRETNYGKWFEVRTEVNPVNLAYTGLGLQAHTDNPYRDPCHRCKFSTVLKTLHRAVTVSLLMAFVPPKFWRTKMPMHLRSLRAIVRGFPMRAVPVFHSTLGDQ